MGDLSVGDVIFDDQGQPTTVLAVHDQPPNAPCFLVAFSDRSTIVADADHLWFTEDRAARISKRVSQTKESQRTRRARLPPEVTGELRKLAEAADGQDLITMQEAAQLVGLPDTHPWLRRIAKRVGPVDQRSTHRSYTYREQGVTQVKTVQVYAAPGVYAALIAAAAGGRHPKLEQYALRLQQLAEDAKDKDLTARDLVLLLTIPYWQACRWLQASGVPYRQESRAVELRVAAKTVRRQGQGSRLYPKVELLRALGDAGDRAIGDQRHKTTAGRVRTTREIRDTLTTSTGHLNHSVPLAQPLDLPEANLPIAPYVLGVWLGDGHSWSTRTTSADPEIVDYIQAEGYRTRLAQLGSDEWKACRDYAIYGIRHDLRGLGLLKTHRDQPPTKRIPAIYLRASIGQRRALLAGLLDTDGTVSPQGTTQLTTVLPGLAEDVLELVRSLGFRPTCDEGISRLNGRDCGPKWTIAFTTQDPVFRLQRKLRVLAERTINHIPERTRSRYITAVRPVESEPVRCISVDSRSHLFLAGRSMVPTHNTVSLIGDAVEAARRGFRVLVVDPKRVEFLGMRAWPNVEVVATTVQDQIAVIHHALQLMNERYRLVEEEGARESEFERVLLIIDEYRQFYANVKGWWASIKITGMPAECPVFEWVGSLLRMAGACGIHVDLGTQRPDAEFLKGEALAVDTPIPTPTGWTTMGDLQVGQYVLDENGTPVRVSATTPVSEGRPCYRLIFSDGTSLVADENHLWAARDAGRRASSYLPMTRHERFPNHSDLKRRLDNLPGGDRPVLVSELEDELGLGRVPLLRRRLHQGRWKLQPIAAMPSQAGRFPGRVYSRTALIENLTEELGSPVPTGRRPGTRVVTTKTVATSVRTGDAHTWSIDTVTGLDLPDVDLPIDPWLLGYWLGDGSRGAATIATADEEVLERIRRLGFRVQHYARYNYGISTGPRGGWNRPSLQRSLRECGLLHNKHIPPAYLRASDAQRSELLAGLLDSDGSCSVRGRGTPRLSAQVKFSNTNPLLIDGVRELAASLGYIPTVTRTRRAGVETATSSVAYGRPTREAWVVRFTPDRQVFGIGRKQRLLQRALDTSTRTARRPRYIVEVVPVPSVPVRCIAVESTTHLYLAGRSFIPTHNCRDNFSARMSTGRLSPDGAQMMYDTQHIGTTVPLNVRGRATMIGTDDAPREVQVYYTPDPRRATTEEDLQLLEALKPDRITHPRRRVVLGDADAARADLAEAADGGDGRKPKKIQPTADEWLELLNARLVPWTPDTEEAPTSSSGTVDDPDEPLEGDDLYADYEPAETLRARRVRPDMLLEVDTDRWVCVTAVDTTKDAEVELQLIAWRDDDDNEGVQEIGSFELIEIRRPSETANPAP